MTDSELENYKILLEDARQTYYNRLSHFGNISTKAGIVLASMVGFVTIINEWFLSKDVLVCFKLAVIVLVGYSTYLSIKVMFVKQVKFMSIDKGVKNLENRPETTTIEWVKALITQYKDFIKEIQAEYDTRNQSLRDALYTLGTAFIIYLLSLVIK